MRAVGIRKNGAIAQDHGARIERLARRLRQAAKPDDGEDERDQGYDSKHQEDAAPVDQVGDDSGGG
jgi:hypothetical protein